MGGKVTPVFNLIGNQFRHDDGTEVTATSNGAVNTHPALAAGEVHRIRLCLAETAGGAVNNVSFTWQYRHPAGLNTWTNINTTTTNIVHAVSSQLVDDADTTEQLSYLGTFIADNNGQCEDGVTTSAACDFLGNDFTNVELSFSINDTLLNNGEQIDLRCLINGAATDAELNPCYFTVDMTVSGVKVVDGIDEANVKSWNGVANASLKTINGVAMP